jgi:hypothetical protein
MNNIFAPYHSNYYRYRRTDLCHSIKAKDVIAGFIDELLSTNYLRPDNVKFVGGRIRTIDEVTWILNQLNTPQSRFMSLLNIQTSNQNWQQWTITPSNLGKGYFFLFICNGCGRNSSYLYMPDGQHNYLCRECHRLSYPTKQQKLAIQKRQHITQTV